MKKLLLQIGQIIAITLCIPTHGAWLFPQKSTKQFIVLPNRTKLLNLFKKSNLSEFIKQTNAIEALAGKKFTGQTLEAQRIFLIDLYERTIEKNSISNETYAAKKRFNLFFNRLLQKYPRIKKDVLEFQKNIKIPNHF